MRALDSEHYVLEVQLRRDRIADATAYPFSLPV